MLKSLTFGNQIPMYEPQMTTELDRKYVLFLLTRPEKCSSGHSIHIVATRRKLLNALHASDHSLDVLRKDSLVRLLVHGPLLFLERFERLLGLL